MRSTLAALLAAAFAALATPAAACSTFLCLGDAVSDDLYPPGEAPLPYAVQEAVQARRGKGLSAAGFYNDPSLAHAHRRTVAYDAPPAFFSWLFPPASEVHHHEYERVVERRYDQPVRRAY